MPTRKLDAAVLFAVATDAADRIKVPDRTGGQSYALISIVFSVVALEAFVNEAIELAEEINFDGGAVATFADLMNDAERLPLETKLGLATWILCAKRIEKGQQPYQDFALLIELRNRLVHFEPNPSIPDLPTPEDLRHALAEKFRSKNVLANDQDPKLESSYSWMNQFQTKAVANWSCRTVALMVEDFVSKTPANTYWRQILQEVAFTKFLSQP